MARDKHPLKSVCTESRQDMARYSFSMRNSRFKDCHLLNLVYKGSPWGERACSSAWPPVEKPEAHAAMLLLEQREAAGAPSRLGRTTGWGWGWERGMLSRHQGPNMPLWV